MNGNTTKPQAVTAGAVTAQYDFHPASANGEKLFSVRAGIPLADAFDQLSVLVSSSIATVDILAGECKDSEGIPGALWQSIHLLNFSYALIQSMHGGHNAHAKS